MISAFKGKLQLNRLAGVLFLALKRSPFPHASATSCGFLNMLGFWGILAKHKAGRMSAER
jgi:hypothetical protein